MLFPPSPPPPPNYPLCPLPTGSSAQRQFLPSRGLPPSPSPGSPFAPPVASFSHSSRDAASLHPTTQDCHFNPASLISSPTSSPASSATSPATVPRCTRTLPALPRPASIHPTSRG